MHDNLRIGTWNVDRSGIRGKRRISGQLQEIERRHADLWILTETHDDLRLHDYKGIASRADKPYHKDKESYVTIWSRWSLRQIPTANDKFTVCAELQAPFHDTKILIYGTIITYGGDGVHEGEAKQWERHRLAVREQTDEWLSLRKEFPGHLMIVAGDFNMNLDPTSWYGVNDAKALLRRQLDKAELSCVTAFDMRAAGLLKSRATIDHICVPKGLEALAKVEVWEGAHDTANLSDHNGVLVELTFSENVSLSPP